jgi:hypothetical protein
MNLELLNEIMVILGIPSIGGMLIRIGRKLQALDGLELAVEKGLQPDLKDIRERFFVVEDRVETLWKDKFAPAHSPRQLNDRGEEILRNSGIRDFVDEKKGVLLEEIRRQAPRSAYDAEQYIQRLMMSDFPKMFPETLDALKDGAFKVGADLDAVLFVGSIYLRNAVFKDLGFDVSDLDKHAK